MGTFFPCWTRTAKDEKRKFSMFVIIWMGFRLRAAKIPPLSHRYARKPYALRYVTFPRRLLHRAKNPLQENVYRLKMRFSVRGRISHKTRDIGNVEKRLGAISDISHPPKCLL